MRLFFIISLFTLTVFGDSVPSYSKLKNAAIDVLVDGNLSGSVTFISEDGCILTAAHIFVKKAKLEVVDHKNTRMNAKLFAIDRGHNLALLKVESDNKHPYLTVSEVGIKLGQKIYHFGSAFFRRGMMQNGFGSEDKPSFEYYGGSSRHSVRVFHISATMQPGTSGGPWVNEKGDIIGVQSGIMVINKSNSGMA